jgi:hypothetical protein
MFLNKEKGLYEIALQYINFDQPTKLPYGRKSLPFTLQYQQCGTNVAVRMDAFIKEARISKKPCDHCIRVNEQKPKDAKSVPCVRSDVIGFNQCALCIMLRNSFKTCKLAHEEEHESDQLSSSPARGWDDDENYDDERTSKAATSQKKQESAGTLYPVQQTANIMNDNYPFIDVDEFVIDEDQFSRAEVTRYNSFQKRPRTSSRGNPIDVPKAGAYDYGRNDADLLNRNFPNWDDHIELPQNKQFRRDTIYTPSRDASGEPMTSMTDAGSSREKSALRSAERQASSSRVSKVVAFDASPTTMAESVMEKSVGQGHDEKLQNRLKQEKEKVVELNKRIAELKTKHHAELCKLKEENNLLKRRVESDSKIQKLQHERAHKSEKEAQELRWELRQLREMKDD